MALNNMSAEPLRSSKRLLQLDIPNSFSSENDSPISMVR
jgi:hypothetical protein